MGINNLFDKLSIQLEKDTNLQDQERFGNTETLRSSVIKGVEGLRIPKITIIFHNYNVQLTINSNDNCIDCNFRNIQKGIGFYYIKPNGENVELYDPALLAMPPEIYNLHELSNWIIEKLLAWGDA